MISPFVPQTSDMYSNIHDDLCVSDHYPVVLDILKQIAPPLVNIGSTTELTGWHSLLPHKNIQSLLGPPKDVTDVDNIVFSGLPIYASVLLSKVTAIPEAIHTISSMANSNYNFHTLVHLIA